MNPLGFQYGTNYDLLPAFAKPSAIIVTGRGNRYDSEFQDARKRGAIVPAYWNPFNIPVGTKNPADLEQWMNDTSKVPRWRYKKPDGTLGPVRSNWPNTEIADITPGSAWRVYFRMISEKMIRSGLFDGFFLDTFGTRLWAVDWQNWPVGEQTLFAECAVDMARDLRELVDAVKPGFELIANNLFDLPKGHPADATADLGNNYLNGTTLENPPPGPDGNRSPYHINYAARQFGVSPRRLLVVAQNQKLFDQWRADPNVTHITLVDKAKGQDYMRVTPALVPYKDERPPAPPLTCEQKLATANQKIASLQDENEKLSTQLEESTKRNADLIASNNDLSASRAELQNKLRSIGSHAAEISKLSS